MTITLTGVELERIDAIKEQIDYCLRHVAGEKSETLIQNFLEVVSAKHIEEFDFFGITPGTLNAKHFLTIKIDWVEHDDLVASEPMIATNNLWEQKTNPDIIMEAQKFLRKCNGLEIDWCFVYSSSGEEIKESLDRKLGSHTIPEEEEIIFPDGNKISYPVQGIGEMKVIKNIG
jgi:hypothetical protein